MRRKIIVDQDAHGPASTNLQSIAMLIAAPEVDVLGICVVSGDGWCDENVVHTLRFLELIGRPDIPIFRGAALPLLNSMSRTRQWEALYGKLFWKGAWTEYFHDGRYREGEHHAEPFSVPALKEGNPRLTAAEGTAAEFLCRTVRQFPGEVSIWAGGPMTNLALACRLDPKFASLAKELFYMGGSYAPKAGPSHFSLEYKHAPRLEFNMRWDPEAASLVLKEAWAQITQIPVDATTQTFWSAKHQQTLSQIGGGLAAYFGIYGKQLPMWDEVAAALWLEPSLAREEETLLVDVDTSFNAGYGNTLSWEPGKGPGLGERPVRVVRAIDDARTEDFAVALLTKACIEARDRKAATRE